MYIKHFGSLWLVACGVIEVNFSKLTYNNQIFRNDFVFSHFHLCKILAKLLLSENCLLPIVSCNQLSMINLTQHNSFESATSAVSSEAKQKKHFQIFFYQYLQFKEEKIYFNTLEC